jgi:hypothetical protein
MKKLLCISFFTLLIQGIFSQEIAAPPGLRLFIFSEMATIEHNSYFSENNITNNFSFNLLSTRLRVDILQADQDDFIGPFFFEITPVIITKTTDASPPDFSFLNAKISYAIFTDYVIIHPLVKCNYLFQTNGVMDFDRFRVKAGVRLGFSGSRGGLFGEYHLLYAETGYAYNHDGKSSHNYYLSIGVSLLLVDPFYWAILIRYS